MVLSKTRTLSSTSRCVPMIRTLGRAWAISEDIERANNNLSGYEKLLSRVMAQRAQSSIWGKAVIPQGMTPYGKTHGAAEFSHARIRWNELSEARQLGPCSTRPR